MNIIEQLKQKDNKQAYQLLLTLEKTSACSNELYDYFDDFLALLQADNSCIRARGFRLICANAMYDTDNKINDNIDMILLLLDDPVSTNVRQYLKALHSVTLYKYELYDKIKAKCYDLDLSKYKASMQELIKKDIEDLLNEN